MQRALSPFVGAGAGVGLLVFGTPGTPFSRLNTINSVDGFGGIVPTGTVRVAAGLSWLRVTRAFAVELFAQELLRGAGVVAPFAAFTFGGLSARVDFAGNFSAIVEGLYGVTPVDGIRGLDATDQRRRLELDLKARKTFKNRLWLGAFFSLSQEGAWVTYAPSKTTFSSTEAPTFLFGLGFGLPLCGEP